MSDALLRQEVKLCSLEAALYSAGRPLELEDLKYVVRSTSERTVKKLVGQLAQRYRRRGGALEIATHSDGRVSLQLRESFDDMVKQFNHRPLLRVGPLKTLSYIAFNQPVDQRQVIADRGTHVYGHLRMMENMGLIHRERTVDRSFIITTTAFFGDYFGFSHSPDKSKLQLKKIFRELKITKLENGALTGLEDPLGAEEEGDRELGAVVSLLADAGDGLPEGLPQYPGAPHNGSK
jgi:segregation and condensation protein B